MYIGILIIFKLNTFNIWFCNLTTISFINYVFLNNIYFIIRFFFYFFFLTLWTPSRWLFTTLRCHIFQNVTIKRHVTLCVFMTFTHMHISNVLNAFYKLYAPKRLAVPVLTWHLMRLMCKLIKVGNMEQFMAINKSINLKKNNERVYFIFALNNITY